MATDALSWLDIEKIPWLILVNLILIFTLPFLFFRNIATLMILLTLFTVFSCANLFYHTMRLEIHSMLVLFLGMTYGWPISVVIGALIYWPAYKLSLRIGLPSPLLSLMDACLIALMGILGSFLSPANYFLYAFLILALQDVLRSIIKFFVFHESPFFYTLMTSIYITATYIILTHFGDKILSIISAGL